MNFQEVLQLTIVQELKTKSVAMFNLLQLYTQGEMSSFKKGFEAEKKNFYVTSRPRVSLPTRLCSSVSTCRSVSLRRASS